MTTRIDFLIEVPFIINIEGKWWRRRARPWGECFGILYVEWKNYDTVAESLNTDGTLLSSNNKNINILTSYELWVVQKRTFSQVKWFPILRYDLFFHRKMLNHKQFWWGFDPKILFSNYFWNISSTETATFRQKRREKNTNEEAKRTENDGRSFTNCAKVKYTYIFTDFHTAIMKCGQ